MNEDSAPGWDAITTALAQIYGAQEPLHYAAVPHFALGGSDPLDGISVYLAHGGSHWHYVSYGMSELYAKNWENPKYSGWGFEFTIRLSRDSNESAPPMWPISMLQNLARYVFKSGNIFDDGHHLDCHGPIALGTETELKALLFVEDPELPAIETPHGQLKFIQVVGVTLDERHAIVCWNAAGMKKLLSEEDPLFVTNLDRQSILNDETVRSRYQAGALQEGSSTNTLYNSTFAISRNFNSNEVSELVLGASITNDFIDLVRGRLLHGRTLFLVSAITRIELRCEPTFESSIEPKNSVLALPRSLCEEILQTLKPNRGLYSFECSEDLIIRVEPSEIKDQNGTVVEIIG